MFNRYAPARILLSATMLLSAIPLTANAAEVRAAINGLFQQLENPSAYNADQFASALRRIRPAAFRHSP